MFEKAITGNSFARRWISRWYYQDRGDRVESGNPVKAIVWAELAAESGDPADVEFLQSTQGLVGREFGPERATEIIGVSRELLDAWRQGDRERLLDLHRP